MASTKSSFWAEGPQRLRKVLEDRRFELKALARRYRYASGVEREVVLTEMRRVLAEYEPTEEELKHCLHLSR